MFIDNPYPLEILGTMPGTAEDEKALHRRFAGHRLVGEWFRPGEEVLAFIAAEATPYRKGGGALLEHLAKAEPTHSAVCETAE